MSELRKDPIVDRWVIISKARAARPQELSDRPQPRNASRVCPFCEGHEDATTPEVAAIRRAESLPDSTGWQVRVVPNKYPALDMSATTGFQVQGLNHSVPAVGVHEVIIESPRHLCTTTELTDAEYADVLRIYRQRLLELRNDSRLVAPLIFKNVGTAAGASIEHLHSQLTVLPIVPLELAAELRGAAVYAQAHGRCVYCQLLADELEQQIRMVEQTPNFVAFCPFASRMPLETWILPRQHQADFDSLADALVLELAQLTRSVTAKIESALDHPAYNYIIHTAPFDTSSFDHYHWHIEIIPRVTKTAGFEWGSGYFINPMPPEEAAALMRSKCPTG